MTKLAYLPTALISDKGSAFMSHIIKEVAGILGNILKHATTKHVETIGTLELSHGSIKQTLKIETMERRSFWHKYVSIAVLDYNTSYRASFACEPSRVFHRHIHCNALDLKMGIRPQKVPTSNSQIVRDLLEQIERIYRDVRKTAMQAYIKYKAYCDKKVNASTLKKRLCFCLTAENISPRKQNSFTDFRCIGLHIIEKVLPKKNCLIRKIGTNKMQVPVEWECPRSQPVNLYRIYKSRHVSGSPTLKLS